MEQITYGAFKPFLNDTFRIEVNPFSLIDVDLVSVDPLGSGQDQDENQAFAIVFRSEVEDDNLLQRIYTVSHPKMGRIEAFLVSIGADDKGMRYEAVFT